MHRFIFLTIVGLLICAPQFVGADDMPGELIDQLMRKQAGEVTAESALPKKPTQDEIFVASAKETPKIVENKIESKSKPLEEDQQPVFSNPTASVKAVKPASTIGMWGRMMGSLAIVLLLFGGCAYGFKKWPGSKKLTTRNKMIEVLAQHHLGPKRSLAVVRVAGESVLVGITENNITILKTLSLLDDDIPKSTAATNTNQKFQNTLMSKFETPASVSVSGNETPAAVYKKSASEAEDFSMQGLREIVGQRLKTMREL